jgi:cyclic pyranopterin monophosphate synthase
LDTPLTHVDSAGAAKMVDTSMKDITRRSATASARIRMSEQALRAIRENVLQKGDALSVARIAGILAAKKVDDLIPLCHSLPIQCVSMDFDIEESSILITATALTEARTGVEMEALTACSIAALTIYDMAKSVDRTMVIYDVRLLSKSGGRSGTYSAPEFTE